MRVKISYTVELDEVENEVAEIMAKAAEDLDNAYHEISGLQNLMATNTGDLEKSLESIDFIRTKMMKADQILDDCHSILQGYRHALKQIEEKENEIKVG